MHPHSTASAPFNFSKFVIEMKTQNNLNQNKPKMGSYSVKVWYVHWLTFYNNASVTYVY